MDDLLYYAAVPLKPSLVAVVVVVVVVVSEAAVAAAAAAAHDEYARYNRDALLVRNADAAHNAFRGHTDSDCTSFRDGNAANVAAIPARKYSPVLWHPVAAPSTHYSSATVAL